ncbi:unnamed protein product, partial [Lymnaea stagnalis]
MTRFSHCASCGDGHGDCLCKNYWQGESYHSQGEPRPHAAIFPHSQHLLHHGLEHGQHTALDHQQIHSSSQLTSLGQLPVGIHGGHTQLGDVGTLSPPTHDARTMASMAYPPS